MYNLLKKNLLHFIKQNPYIEGQYVFNKIYKKQLYRDINNPLANIILPGIPGDSVLCPDPIVVLLKAIVTS